MERHSGELGVRAATLGSLNPFWSESETCSVACDSVIPRAIQSVEFSRPEYWSRWPFPSPGDLPNPGIKPRSPALQADSLPAEPPGKPMNTGVGSLSLLQWIFLSQESNWGLLHCRWILYQLDYQGSPNSLKEGSFPGLLLASGQWPCFALHWLINLRTLPWGAHSHPSQDGSQHEGIWEEQDHYGIILWLLTPRSLSGHV